MDAPLHRKISCNAININYLDNLLQRTDNQNNFVDLAGFNAGVTESLSARINRTLNQRGNKGHEL